MTDMRLGIELVTPGLNLLEDHGEGAKSVIERTKKILHEAADRIEQLERELGEERHSREVASAKAWEFSDRIKELERVVVEQQEHIRKLELFIVGQAKREAKL